jgi:hypothetical protein
MRLRLILAAAWTGACLFWPAAARAEHFDIQLTVRSPNDEGRAGWDTEPPTGGVNPRPVVRAHTGDTIQLEWIMRSVYPHGTMKQVKVRLFVAREKSAGQKEAPEMTDLLADNTLTLDFLPDHAARGSLRFRAPRAATYLVRLESVGTVPAHDHEHFSAVDLTVE